MKQNQLSKHFLDQSKDLYWMVNLDFQLIFANKAYLSLAKKVTGADRKMKVSVFLEGFSENYNAKWKDYYIRALKGEFFEIEEHYFHSESNNMQYGQTTFQPIRGDDEEIYAVACQSKNSSHLVKQRSEANQLIDASLDVFCTVNEKGDFVYVSAASENLWGYLPDELIGKAYVNFILEEDLLKTTEAAATILNGHDTNSFVNRYKKKNGDIAYNLWSVRWDQSTKLMYCVARDAKEKIDQEEKIELSRKRFESLVENSLDCVIIISPEGKTTYVSGSINNILGYSPAEAMDIDFRELVHPEDLADAENALERCINHPGISMKGSTSRVRHKNGSWRWIEPVITNLLHDPSVRGIVDNFRDITTQKEEEIKLKLLESVVTNTNDAILIIEAEEQDESGPKIIYANEAFTKMTGYEAAEVIGKTPGFLHGANTNKEERAKLSNAIRNWESCEITTINYKKNGEEFWINFTVTPVANEKGLYTHWITIQRDVTEQKTKELEKDLINKISDIFNQSNDNDLTACLDVLCKHIAKFGDFDSAEIWLPAIDAKTINRVTNYAEGRTGHVFYEATKNLKTCDFGEGLPGYVWKTKTTELWMNVEGKWLAKRQVAAKKAGIEAMMGVPLKHKEEVIGVLLLGTIKTKSALAQYIELLKKLRLAIGSELSRKKTEIELAQIFDFSPDMICVAGFDGYIKRINPAGLALLGYSLEEMRSQPIKSFIHEEDRLLTIEKQKELYIARNPQNFENRYVTKQGKIVWLSWTATSAPEHGVVYAVAKDITEEKNLTELNRQVGRLAKIGSWEVDLVNQTVYWSDEVHQLYGTDPNTFVPNIEAAINFYREDFRQIARSCFEECISTRESYDIETVIVTSSKKELWVRTTAKAEYVDDVCTRVYGSFQDINDRKEVEIRLRSLADNIPGIIYEYHIHPDGTASFQNISGRVEENWGFKADEVKANRSLVWEQIEAGGQIKDIQASILKSIEKKSKFTSRIKYVMPTTGELRTHLVYGIPAFLTDGTIIFNSILLDITQEAKNEELLQQITKIARIGSWEMDLVNQEGDTMYWSPMLFEILEIDDNYNPTLTGGIEFHVGESKERIRKAVELLINEGTEFDEEILLLTAKGKKQWSRAIGKNEMVNNKRTRIYGSYQDIDERKRSEIKLTESENKFRAILEAEPDCVKLLGPDGKLLMINQAGLSMIEADSEEQVIDKSMLGILLPKHRTAFTELIDNVFKGESGKLIFEVEGFKGTHRWLETHSVPLKNEQGKITSLLGITRDISERKKVEEERNSLLFTIENSLNEIYIFDEETYKFTYVNKGALLNLGYSSCEIKTLTPLDLKPAYSESTFKLLVTPLVNREKEKIVFFTNHKRKNGTLYPAEIHLQLVSDGNTSRFLAIILDITERKKSEEDNRFKAKLLSTIGQATIATNLDGIVNYWNHAAESIYGWTLEEAIGKNVMHLTTPHTNEKQAKQIMEVLIKGQRWSGKFKVQKKDGTIFTAQITNAPIYDENNNLSGIIGISSDISKEVQNEELIKQYTHELERSNEELEQFAFVASHDLQEPLRMIGSFMDLLKRKYGDQLDEKGNQYIHFATDGAKRMKQIILDLLEFSRATRPSEGIEEVDLNEVLSEFKLLRRKLISEKSAKIKYNSLPTINTHRAAIIQIIHCLIDNALIYSKENTPPIIEINAIESEKEWKFSIKDNGKGIDSQFYDKIFIIFQKLQNKEKYSGTGIGLSIAKRHIEFLGGRIWLDSILGKGTVFYFTIPKTIQYGL